MKIRIIVIDKENYLVKAKKRMIPVDRYVLFNILERLVLDNVVEEIEIKIKKNCEECEEEALDIILD